MKAIGRTDATKKRAKSAVSSHHNNTLYIFSVYWKRQRNRTKKLWGQTNLNPLNAG